MFNKKSDYALNKGNKDTIVCKNAVGENICLTKDEFASEDEFLCWKNCSDADYHEEEKSGRGYERHTIELNEQIDNTALSAGDILLESFLAEQRRKLAVQIKECLTETQFQKLWSYYVDGKSVTEIAKIYRVSKARISRSISAAEKN